MIAYGKFASLYNSLLVSLIVVRLFCYQILFQEVSYIAKQIYHKRSLSYFSYMKVAFSIRFRTSSAFTYFENKSIDASKYSKASHVDSGYCQWTCLTLLLSKVKNRVNDRYVKQRHCSIPLHVEKR